MGAVEKRGKESALKGRHKKKDEISRSFRALENM
jgi:hypothetical protein